MKYYIPRFNLSKLKSLITKLSKKTKVEFSYDENDIKLETLCIRDNANRVDKVYKYATIGVDINIDYKVGDYELVAQLEHTGNGNIVRRINPNAFLPDKYLECTPCCEHCKTTRRRSITYVLMDNNKHYIQVGKNCLKDFIGYDNGIIIQMVSSLYQLFHEEEFDEELLMGEPKWELLDEFLNRVYQLVKKEGYSKEKNNPLEDLDSFEYDKTLNDKVEEIKNVVNTSWYNNSEYCHNCKVIMGLNVIEPKHFRIIASYVNSAMNYLQKQEAIKEAKKSIVNDYLGNEGDKIEFNIKSFKVLYTKESQIGYGRWVAIPVYRIITDDNHIIIWASSNGLKENALTVRATVKGHKDYNEEKQTVITRGKVVSYKELEQPKQESSQTEPTESSTKALEDFLAFVDSSEFDWDAYQKEIAQ